MGITIIILSAVLGTVARGLWRRRAEPPRPLHFLALGGIVQLMQLAAFTQIPAGAGHAFITQAWWVLLLVYPPATMLLCLLFQQYEQRRISQATLQAAQAAAAHERTFLRTLLDTLPHLVWLKDPEGVYLRCNRRFEALYGHREEEIVGKTDYDFVDPALADFFRAHDRKAMERNGPSTNEEEVTYASDGHRELIETTKTPLRDADGRLIGVLGTAHDITHRKQTELELRESQFQLSAAQRIAQMGSWYLDLKTQQVTWSEALYELYGIDPAQSPPLYTESAKLFTPESWTRLSTALQHCQETGTPYVLELQTVREDGRHGWILARGEPVHDAHGAVMAVRGIVQNITERKHTELELIAYRKHLEAMVEARTAELAAATEAAEAANIAKSAFLA
ncbi:MAG: PAS domain-containing protein, partial [Rhodocyclaceae bacterium]|nr:PAS domain-containing protein [Rhodocyclaceae bacterium]